MKFSTCDMLEQEGWQYWIILVFNQSIIETQGCLLIFRAWRPVSSIYLLYNFATFLWTKCPVLSTRRGKKGQKMELKKGKKGTVLMFVLLIIYFVSKYVTMWRIWINAQPIYMIYLWVVRVSMLKMTSCICLLSNRNVSS